MSYKAVILDIEGTVCPIAFVKDILFPYSLSAAKEQISKVNFPLDAEQSQDRADLVKYLSAFPDEYKSSQSALLGHIEDLTRRDQKIPYLKSLQGYLWKSGYENGEVKAPLYDDAVDAIKRWKSNDIKVYIYSSGSVAAQKLLFEHAKSITVDGKVVDENVNLLPILSGYYDTVNAGPKTIVDSYKKILAAIDLPAPSVLFLSDNIKEIDAAKEAEINAKTVFRPGNSELSEADKNAYKPITTFADL